MSSSPREAYFKSLGYDLYEALKEEYDYNKQVHQDQVVNISFEQFVENKLVNSEEYQYYKKEMSKSVAAFYKDTNIVGVKLLESYPMLENYRYNITDYLKKISNTKFKMNYKVKYMARKPMFNDNGKLLERGELIDLNYKMRDFQQLFSMDVKDEKIILNFNTPLGKLIIHNMLIVDTDWLPVDALNLSKNAYFLYKRFVLNKRSGRYKANKIKLEFEDLKAFLDLKWSNDRGVHAIIVRALNDMKEKGLINGFVCKKNVVNRRFYELDFEKEKKEPQRKKEEDTKILKMIA
jgi:hypothetical protein